MDREKVINGLALVREHYRRYYSELDSTVIDALILLKEQEAVTVESIQVDRSDKWGADLTGYCPSCKRPLKSRFNKRFCGECGQEVKWDA